MATKKGGARKGKMVGSRLAYDDTTQEKRKMTKKKTRKTAKKTGRAVIDGKVIKFKEGALHRQLKFNGTFTRASLNRMKKIEVGKRFTFKGKSFKMTDLLKKRVTFALVLMGKRK